MRVRNILLLVFTLLTTGCVVVQEGPTQSEKASKINVQLGIGYYYQGNLELANEKLQKAIAQDPKSSQAHHAYAVLQNRFLNRENADYHFQKAIEYDENNSEALNNYGAFLCQDEKFQEAKGMFMRAVKNPLYKAPELAYTNAALCLRNANLEPDTVKEYLTKALGVGNNFGPALLTMAEISYEEKNQDLIELYLTRYYLSNQPSARSLWLEIRNELDQNNEARAAERAELLRENFADSDEYKSWLELSK